MSGWTDLLGLPPGEHEYVIPGSTPAVRLRRLHRHGRSGASLALVDFPAGWRRPEPGYYLAGEEFVVLRGSLVVGDLSVTAGEWAWVPPRAHRGPSASPDGARALAWFSAPPDWVAEPGTHEPAAHAPLPASPGRMRRDGVPGTSAVEVPAASADADRDLLRVDDLAWCFVWAGESVPAQGRCLVRAWR